MSPFDLEVKWVHQEERNYPEEYVHDMCNVCGEVKGKTYRINGEKYKICDLCLDKLIAQRERRRTKPRPETQLIKKPDKKPGPLPRRVIR